MGIKKQPDGTYTVSYYKRHPVTRVPARLVQGGAKSLSEARRIQMSLALKLEQKLHQAIIPKWGEFVQTYFQHSLSENTRKTADNYLKCISHHTLDSWGRRLIDSINTDEIRTLIKDRVGGRSVSHQRNMVHFIRKTFQLAVERGILNRNPTPQMKFKTGDKIKTCLTEDQVRTLLTRANEYDWEWYPHVATALYTGMRNGELYALTWDKVNLDQRTILVDQSWNNIDGFKCTKSGDDRIVEIAPPLLIILKELKLQSKDTVFVLPRVSQWEQGRQAQFLRTFLMGIGLPMIRFHDLRATWATIMLSKGVEPAKVMFMGGWKDMKTLMVYLRKSGISIKGITNRLMLHDPSTEMAKVLNFTGRSQS